MKINWSEDNIRKLKELNDSKKTHTEMAIEFKCSTSAISAKLSQLKLRSKNINFWRKEEEWILINEFKSGRTINFIAKILNRSSPFLCKKAKELNLISEKSKLIQEQLELKKQGKRKCRKCNNIYPFTSEYFNNRNPRCKDCDRKERVTHYKKYKKEINLERLIKIRCSSAYQRACKKGLDFDITPEYLMEIYNKQNGLCFYSGIKMEIALKEHISNNFTLSIDRVSSHIGYIKENIVLCCDAVNTMKMQLETLEFLDICKKIVEYSKTNII